MAKRLTEKQKSEIAKYFKKGKTIEALSEEFNCTTLTITRNLKKNLGEIKYKQFLEKNKNFDQLSSQLEIDKKELRNHRNILLMESDWTQNRDVVLSNDEEWKTYRQALRDLPANTSDWRNPTYPTKPS